MYKHGRPSNDRLKSSDPEGEVRRGFKFFKGYEWNRSPCLRSVPTTSVFIDQFQLKKKEKEGKIDLKHILFAKVLKRY